MEHKNYYQSLPYINYTDVCDNNFFKSLLSSEPNFIKARNLIAEDYSKDTMENAIALLCRTGHKKYFSEMWVRYSIVLMYEIGPTMLDKLIESANRREI